MDKFVTEDCGETCPCIGNDDVECNRFVCGNNAVCDVRSGVRGCFCKDDKFEMLADGKTCACKLEINSRFRSRITINILIH